MIAAFASRVREAGARGLHLVTSPGAANTRFYLRNGFTECYERSAAGNPEAGMLFMAKPL